MRSVGLIVSYTVKCVIVIALYKNIESQIPIVTLQMCGVSCYTILLNDAFAIKVVQTFSVGAGLFHSCESPRFFLGMSLFALHMSSFVLAGSVTRLFVVFIMSFCP